jgi:hypothetical protein
VYSSASIRAAFSQRLPVTQQAQQLGTSVQLQHEVCYLLEQAKLCSISEEACQTKKLHLLYQAVGKSFCISYIKWRDNYIQQFMHKMKSWPQLMLQLENHYIHSMKWYQFSVVWYNLFVEHLSASACWSLRALEQLDKKISISICESSQCKISAQCS